MTFLADVFLGIVLGALYGVYAERQFIRKMMLNSGNANVFLKAMFLHLTGKEFKS
jgi:NhaP-type Na+/H+ and K+/H+ antiporter